MRVAVVSDVHGDLDALEAVVRDLRLQAADLVLQGGDLAVLGPEPAAVVDRVRELGWPGVQGNTDELLWRPELRGEKAAAGGTAGEWALTMFDLLGPWAAERLGPERIDWLRRLPTDLDLEGVWLVHARPGDLWSAPQADAADAELAEVYAAAGPRQAVYGHIHKPFHRRVGDLAVANAGSAGLPSDGDPRPSYLLIDSGKVTVRRVAHDQAASESRIRASGFPLPEWLIEFKRRAAFSPP